MNLHNFILKKVPKTVYYIPDFITLEEENYLLQYVNEAPKPKWTQLLNRRLQMWGGTPHAKGMLAEKIPQWLEKYMERIKHLGIFDDRSPNHVLVNEYLPGQGIMPHLDGPLYYPTVSTISLGSHTVLDFYSPLNECKDSDVHNEDGKQFESTSYESRHLTSIFLQPRSLVLIQDDMYNTYLHGIQERTEDQISDKVANAEVCDLSNGDCIKRSTRISLTIRHVPKVLKTHFLLGKKR